MSLTLAQASSIVDATLKKARELKQMSQTVVVLDGGGHLVCAKREDGSGILRFEIAVGKAYGALGMGWGSRTMMERAAQNRICLPPSWPRAAAGWYPIRAAS